MPDYLTHLTDGMLGALSTIIAGGAAILATWILARKADAQNRQAAAIYAVSTIENFLQVLWEKAMISERKPDVALERILSRDPVGFAYLRDKIGLLGMGQARIFIYVDRLAGDLQETSNAHVKTIREAYDKSIELYEMCVESLPDSERKTIKKRDKFDVRLARFREHNPVTPKDTPTILDTGAAPHLPNEKS